MFRPVNPFDRAAKNAFQTLRSADNPVPWPDWAKSWAFSSALRQFMASTPQPLWHKDFPYYETGNHPHAIRYRVNTRGRVVHPGGERLGAWRVELARFAVPQRYFGIVRGFEQYMGEVGEGGVNQVISFGDPFADANWGIAGRWFMRLFPYRGEIRQWISQLNPIEERPGIPFIDWEDQTGLWYPANSDAGQNIRLTVPGGWELSVFWECDNSITQLPAVAAAFKGGIQSSFNERALDTAMSSWG